MATALAKGLITSGFAATGSVIASDPLDESRDAFARETGAKTTASNADVAAASEVVVLAVKPQTMPGVLAEIAGALEESHLVVSIAAGVTIGTLAGALGAQRRLIRVMPNTPCLVGASASGYSLGPAATPEDGRLVEALLVTVGIAVEVPEPLLDAVTGLSGSGPAYVYQIIEALSDGGVRMGLPRDVATRLAAQTLLGAAKMVLQTGEHPGALKDAVTSPGGTTIAGIAALERNGLRSALIEAVEAATLRSRELGRPA
jgi:pyrroline-5-carboxylate reductase